MDASILNMTGTANSDKTALSLTDLPTELLEIIISFIGSEHLPSAVSPGWARNIPGANPKAFDLKRDPNVVHAGNWRHQIKKMRQLGQLASTCRLFQQIVRFPRHLFINLYPPSPQPFGTLGRSIGYNAIANSDDPGLIEVSSQPIGRVFRTLSLYLWHPQPRVPKTWVYDCLLHFAKPHIENVNVGLRNLYYDQEEGIQHLQGLVEGVKNAPEQWQHIKTFNLAVRPRGREYANPRKPAVFCQETLRDFLQLFSHAKKISIEIDYADLGSTLPFADAAGLRYYVVEGEGLIRGGDRMEACSKTRADLEDEGFSVPDFDLSLRAEYLKKNPDGSRNDIAVSKVVTNVKFRLPDNGVARRATFENIEMSVDQQRANEVHRGLWANVQWRTDYDVEERDEKYFEAFPHMREFLK